ncbi:MAG: prepilin-type N-terminal cleavage/methylation domain-containing protein [Verrucomicrobiae bacterium]|nr:prepilin-type N-terminal cleavage/methylation domain-containing protein [Verrucomicrobiae bacterium]
MKLRAANPAAPVRGFTLVEILIAMAILVIVVGGILSAHIFGLRMFQVNATKLAATEWSRTTFRRITDEVRAGNVVEVGNLNSTNGAFEGLLDGEPQRGTGLLIYPTTDTNSYILYFLNTADQTFRRATDQAGSAVILADSVTNTLVFSAQDFSGNLLTNITSSKSPVIHLALEFYQPEKFLQNAQEYKLETSMTRRAKH